MNDMTAEKSKKARGKILPIIALVFIVIGVSWWALDTFVLSLREKTDNAYVNANLVTVSSQVPGTAIDVAVEDTALVEAGQVLVRLDPVDSQAELAKAAATLADTVRKVRQQFAMAAEADAAVTTRGLELKRAEADLARRKPLLADNAIAGEEVRHAQEAVDLARAVLAQAREQSLASHTAIDNVTVAENPQVLVAREHYRDAWLNAKRNAIVSPIRGYVAQRNVQLGQRIMPGQTLMSIIPLDGVWIDANFKESQIRNIRIGQPVAIDSDVYGSAVIFHGTVAGLAAGTGSAFSLLPAQNASGNWIKVIQRVPVRVKLDAKELADHPLRVGMSSNVTVDTRQRDGAVLAVKPVTTSASTTDVYAANWAEADAAADAIIRKNGGR